MLTGDAQLLSGAMLVLALKGHFSCITAGIMSAEYIE